MSLNSRRIGLLVGLMSTVEEIKKRLVACRVRSFGKLTDQLIARREQAWDAQLEADAAAGRLDTLWSEAEKEIDAGQSQSRDAFLGHQKL